MIEGLFSGVITEMGTRNQGADVTLFSYIWAQHRKSSPLNVHVMLAHKKSTIDWLSIYQEEKKPASELTLSVSPIDGERKILSLYR